MGITDFLIMMLVSLKLHGKLIELTIKGVWLHKLP